MNNKELADATARLADAVHFRQATGGWWYPDLLVDRHALTLAGVPFRPCKTEDGILALCATAADSFTCQFDTPPLGRRLEAAQTVDAFLERAESLRLIGEKRALSVDETAKAIVYAAQLEELDHPTAEVLDDSKKILWAT